MSNMNARASSLQDQVRYIMDYIEIQQIFARYVPGLDSASGDVVASDFTEDGVFDLGPLGVHRGREEIRAFADRDNWTAEGLAAFARGAGHVLNSPLITIDGDTAVGTCTSMIYFRGEAEYRMTRLTVVRLELARTAEGWRITKRFNRLVDETGEAVALYRSAVAAKGA